MNRPTRVDWDSYESVWSSDESDSDSIPFPVSSNQSSEQAPILSPVPKPSQAPEREKPNSNREGPTRAIFGSREQKPHFEVKSIYESEYTGDAVFGGAQAIQLTAFEDSRGSQKSLFRWM